MLLQSYRNTAILVAAILLTAGCNEDITLPDLNPNTGEGSAITIVDIGETISYQSKPPYSAPWPMTEFHRDIDFDGNGSTDIELYGSGKFEFGTQVASFLKMNSTSEVLSTEYFPLAIETAPLFLPPNALTGGVETGFWVPANDYVNLLEYNSESVNALPKFPVGLSYLPVRSKVGADHYYGWLEFLATDYNDANAADQFVINRYGLSQEPGLRIRMGQEW